MKRPSPVPSPAPQPAPTGRAARRVPLRERNRIRRAENRRRIAARPQTPLSPDQRAFDPFARQRMSRRRRMLKALASVFGSTAAHALLLAVAILIGGIQGKRRNLTQQIAIEVRQEKAEEKKPEEKPLPPPPKPKAPAPHEVRVARVEPVPQPPEPKPEPPKKGPPPRIVGISLDSTAAGGDGPAFAVGDTRMGQTPDRQVDRPKEAPPENAPVSATKAVGTGQGGTGNKVATRLPTAGVKYTMPSPKGGSRKKPKFPETLKAQGVESDVVVMISINAQGKVTDVKVIKPSQYPEFDEAARAAALSDEFEPATRDGEAIPYSISFTYRFRLEDE